MFIKHVYDNSVYKHNLNEIICDIRYFSLKLIPIRDYCVLNFNHMEIWIDYNDRIDSDIHERYAIALNDGTLSYTPRNIKIMMTECADIVRPDMITIIAMLIQKTIIDITREICVLMLELTRTDVVKYQIIWWFIFYTI